MTANPDSQPQPLTTRRAGILLHPTSLPSPFAIGDLGPGAEAFLRWAREAGQRLWQVLPLGPTGYGDSPYGALSSHAGNPLLISPELLQADGLVTDSEIDPLRREPSDRVDYGSAFHGKHQLLRTAFARFQSERPERLAAELEALADDEGMAPWLSDWCLFIALKARHDGRAWMEWEPALRWRDSSVLSEVGRELEQEIAYHRFCQLLFFRQWRRLRGLARELDLQILGDLPIYPALDSADVWAAPELFELDQEGRPLAVAGVPPDYFSETGQLWGNPLYRWERHREQGFDWWLNRIGSALRLFDRVRLDHFRAFESFWSVPASARTAAEGSWQPGPGIALFEAARARFGGELPLVAEDLGVITPEVEALLVAVDLPRMKVLQFAFDEPNSPHLPHFYLPRAVVYTGTHDNDTTRGWFGGSSKERKQRLLEYLGVSSGRSIEQAMIRLAYLTVAETAVIPMQDILGLGGEARMNHPGESGGNWGWRVRSSDVAGDTAQRLRKLAEISGRLPTTGTAEAPQGQPA